MSRIFAIIIALAFGVSMANGQDRTVLQQRINEIKKQNDIYYWNQFTGYDADSSKYYATDRLLLEVNNNRNDDEQLSVEELMPYASYISIDRGNAKQVFTYIKKTDAAAIGNPSVVAGDVTTNQIITPTQPAFVPDAFVQRIMETKDFMNVYKLLKSLKAQGQILQFGKLKDVGDYSSFDLILFDLQSQEAITMLSSETASGKRINLTNGTEDSLDNYPTNMTAVIWYIKK